MPILMLTAKAAEKDRIHGLEQVSRVVAPLIAAVLAPLAAYAGRE